MILLILAVAVAVGLAIRPAMRADRLDRFNEYHLFHAPNSNCVECRDK